MFAYQLGFGLSYYALFLAHNAPLERRQFLLFLLLLSLSFLLLLHLLLAGGFDVRSVTLQWFCCTRGFDVRGVTLQWFCCTRGFVVRVVFLYAWI
jgi:hypothetical protein